LSAANCLKFFYSGSHRIIAPIDTLKKVRPLLGVLGITRIANITGLDRIGIPVCMACRPNSRSLSVSQGKGLDVLSAKASAVMESIESYHAEHAAVPLRLGSYEELRYAHACANPKLLPRPDDQKWHPYLPILWTEATDFVTEQAVLVPYELVHLNATLDSIPGEGSFLASSSGLASGNHLLEAISHAICELIERDALALSRLLPDWSARRLDLSTVDDAGCRWLIDKFQAVGIELGVWDVSSDVGVAAYLCCGLDSEQDHFHPMPVAVGSGCHPSRSVALSRALTEAAQCRATLIAGTRDDLSARDYEYLFSAEAASPWRKAIEAPASRSFQSAPDFLSDNLHDDVEWELAQLRHAGLNQVIVVDLTKPEFQVPVVRVIIPGLEPDDEDRKLGPRSLVTLNGKEHP
jgi:ribosomal protein S12 methylthiotransferase accessory factor